MKKKIIIGSVGLLLVAGAYFMFGKKKVEQQASGVVTKVIGIARGDLSLTVSANGVVQPINNVEIKSKGSGQIVELNFQAGQQVRKGELLLVLDQTTTRNDYNQAAAELELQQATVEQQENNFKRISELFEKNLVSQQELDQAKVARVSAKSQLVKANAALSSAAEKLRDTRIVSPVSGIILSKNVELGQIISSGVSNVGGGTSLATVADMKEVDVQTNVDEVDIGKIAVGQEAQVVADAFPDDKFSGKIVRIAPLGSTTQNVTTFSVIVRVKNEGGKLKAGMSASVDIAVFNRSNVLRVPNEALVDPESDEGKQLSVSLQQTDQRGGSVGSAPPDDGSTDNSKKRQDPLSGPPPDFAPGGLDISGAEHARRRQEFEERMSKLSDEERKALMARMPPPDGFEHENTAHARRFSQADTTGSKTRIVLVKAGEGFQPRLVRIGLTNYDYAEVVNGLREGEQVQSTTVSRAKQSSDEMSQRFKSAKASSGITGGGAPPPP